MKQKDFSDSHKYGIYGKSQNVEKGIISLTK